MNHEGHDMAKWYASNGFVAVVLKYRMPEGVHTIPLSDAEVRMTGIENVSIDIDVEVGQNVTITSGPLENFVGTIQEINKERQKLKVSVSMFGRDTIVELDFVQVHKI